MSNDYDTIDTTNDDIIIEVRQRLTGIELDPIDSLVQGESIEVSWVKTVVVSMPLDFYHSHWSVD